MCRYPSGVVISFLLGVCPEGRLLGHTVVLFLICLGSLTPSFTVAVPIYICTSVPLSPHSSSPQIIPSLLPKILDTIDYDSVSINCEYCMIHIFQCLFIKAILKSKPVEDNLGYFHLLLHSNVLNSGSLCGPGLVLKLLCCENLLKGTPSHREKKIFL